MKPLAGMIGEAMEAHRAGDLDLAGTLYAGCLKEAPDHPDLLHLSGLVLHQRGNHSAALASIDRAIGLRPGTPLFLGSRGAVLLALQREAEALEVLEQAVTLKPDDASNWTRLGLARSRCGNLDGGLAAHDRALLLNPDSVDALINRGNLRERTDDIDGALTDLGKARQLAPANPDILNNLGFACLSGNRTEEAERWLDQCLEQSPDHAEAHLNRAHLLLVTSRFEAGWEEYEWRRRRAGWRIANAGCPEWQGEALSGRKIVILSEQGYGDLIQFSRHAAELAERGAEVNILCDPVIRDLLSTVPGVAAVHGDIGDLPPQDFFVPSMSLPFRLGVGGQSADGPYLSSPVPPKSEGGIGFCAFGNPGHRNDHRRSLPVELAAGWVDDRFISLHRDIPAELDDPPPALSRRDDIRDFNDLAALVSSLDLVITVDTAVAHLAAALGTECLVLLPFAPDWRWGLDSPATPLYPRMRLFRQPSPGDWPSVLDAVEAALNARGGQS
jgi:tetratricopeptide (TPR) repeat protein